jgi:enoyl-CoA hydratase/carnithine racemase
MEYQSLVYERRNRLTFITLNRPHRLNALDEQLMYECGRAWREFKEDPDQWVAVVSGAGRAFCAGGDIKQFGSRLAQGKGPVYEDGSASDERFRGWGPRHYGVHKPIVVAVHGICTAGGLDFVTEGDIVVASRDAVFFDSHVSIGWISGHEAMQLARRVPLGEAMQIALMGGHFRLSAQRAYEIGLVQQLVSDGQALKAATEIAEKIAQNSPGAVWGTKQSVWRSIDLPMKEALKLTKDYIAQHVETSDFTEGPKAVAQGRTPNWEAPQEWTEP